MQPPEAQPRDRLQPPQLPEQLPQPGMFLKLSAREPKPPVGHVPASTAAAATAPPTSMVPAFPWPPPGLLSRLELSMRLMPALPAHQVELPQEASVPEPRRRPAEHHQAP